MRKAHDGLFAGSGTYWSYYEEKEMYQDIKVETRLPYDFMTTEQRKNLSGPVKVYYIEVDEDA